jgi:hypothetical protein
MDNANQYQNNLETNVSKTRLDNRGINLGKYAAPFLRRASDYCGSCYAADAVGTDGKPICCNSCSAVFAAYEHKNLAAPSMDSIKQCVEEEWPTKIRNHAGEGCRVTGSFQVSKVAGNFHFAPGHSYDAYGYHLHDVRFLEGLHLDFSHKIHHLSFGERHPELKNPLDGTSNTAAPERSFKYYNKVVSTIFTHLSGRKVNTNQYAVTKNDQETSGDRLAFPSVFFYYDISPMTVRYTETRKSFSSLLIELFAIVGGVYMVAAMIDAIIYQAERQFRQKMSIGKVY